MHQIAFESIVTQSGMEAVSRMAAEIWTEHYGPIIGNAQVNYMLEKFQSPAVIAGQIKEGYEYFFLCQNGEKEGYMGIQPQNGRLFLSKLYVRKSSRGQGVARAAAVFARDLCRSRGLSAIWLTVNRNNTGAVSAYKKLGFEVIREEAADIGEGYVMDDYIMEMRV